MENISGALYQFLGAVILVIALAMFYRMDKELNQSIDYRVQNPHYQKALYNDVI